MPTKKIPDHDTIPSPSTECLLTHYPPTHPSTPTPYFTTTATHSASLASITTTGRLEVSPFETQLILYNRGLFSFNPPSFHTHTHHLAPYHPPSNTYKRTCAHTCLKPVGPGETFVCALCLSKVPHFPGMVNWLYVNFLRCFFLFYFDIIIIILLLHPSFLHHLLDWIISSSLTEFFFPIAFFLCYRRGPLLSCLKAVISPERPWQPG